MGILALNIVDGVVLTVLLVLSAVLLAYLVSRRSPARRVDDQLPTRRRRIIRWLITLAIGIVGGAAVGLIVVYVSEVLLNSFGGTPIETDTNVWAVAAFAACGIAVVNFWKSRWWRKIIAAIGIVAFCLTATVGINASYGLNPTVASLLNITVADPVALPPTTPVPSATPTATVAPVPLWQSWVAPAGMPATGKFGTVSIPAPVSGFVARPAYLYLPPAALVPNPPALPILILMMGQPGGPVSSELILKNLDAAAAAHGGLGAIVLTVDQIGSPAQNPLCIDSPRGKVRTYVMTDVINYIKANLHVSTDRIDWAVGGYSNGGECALSFGARYPAIFGSILDVSGEIGPSLGNPDSTLKLGFGGDAAFYKSEQPLTILSQNFYPDTLAIFTNGSKDTYYGAEVTTAEAAASAAGMKTHRFIGDGVGHRSDAIVYGIPAGLPLLYQRWNLAEPPQ